MGVLTSMMRNTLGLLALFSLHGLVCCRRDVVCDRERDHYYWWMTSSEYFTCEPNEKCCGDAWNRHCCDKGPDDGIIIGLAILFSILTLALLCSIISLYHYKKKTKHYHNVVHWYENIRPKKSNHQEKPLGETPLGAGGWNLPGKQTNMPDIPTMTGKINIEGPAQPYIP